MSGDSGGGTQRVFNETKPDPITQQWRTQVMNRGNALLNQGVPGFYPGATTAPFSDATMQGLNFLQDYASQGAPLFGEANAAASRALSGSNPAMPLAQQWANGQNPLLQSVTAAGNQHVAGQVAPMISGASQSNPWGAAIAGAGAQPTTAGVGQIQDFASGAGTNPYLRSMFDAAAAPVTDAVNANFAKAGRFGPNAAHTGALTRELSNLSASIFAPAYEQERGRQLSAASMLPGIQQADRAAAMQGMSQAGSLFESGMARGLQGAGLYGDIATADAGRGLTAANAAAGYGFQGAGLFGDLSSTANDDAVRTMAMLPGLYSYGLTPGQNMLDVGSIYEGQAQNYIDADRERYQYNANAPWKYLSQYAGMMSGLPTFDSSTETTRGPGPDRLMQGLGAAGSIASIFAAFSDRRLKREIEPAGVSVEGLPWYHFAYLWDPPGVRRLGVMADEAPPHAVSVHPSGYLVVDYAAL